MSKKDFEDLSLIDGFMVLSVVSDLKCGPACGRLLAEGLLHEKVGYVKIHAEKIVPGIGMTKRGIRTDWIITISTPVRLMMRMMS